MINLQEHVKKHFLTSIELKKAAFNVLTKPIAAAAELLAQRLRAGKKILCCGNGGSASDSQHFASEMINRLQIERPGLPAIALTADMATITSIANDYSYDRIFARQVSALGKEGDILFAISTSGNSANVLAAVHAAHTEKMQIVALTGGNGGKIKDTLLQDDIEICVPSNITMHIQEVHITVIHCLCDLIDHQLFIK